MKRFVVHFDNFTSWEDERQIETRINDFAEQNKLKIIQISPLYLNGIYVLFEESEETEE